MKSSCKTAKHESAVICGISAEYNGNKIFSSLVLNIIYIVCCFNLDKKQLLTLTGMKSTTTLSQSALVITISVQSDFVVRVFH